MNSSLIPPLDRKAYFLIGFALMAIKYNLDRLVSWYGFHRVWYFWNYLKPHGFSAIDAVPPTDATFYLILLLTSLPFLATGIYLTLRRLRSADLPLGLCLLFFVPLINLIFFAILSVIPAKSPGSVAMAQPLRASWLPTSAIGSALSAMVIVGCIGAALAFLSTTLLQNYGLGLFISLPFAMGLVTVLIYAGRQHRGLVSCLLVSMLPIGFAGLCLLLLAVEGSVCLLMAAPLGLVLSILGGMVGYVMVDNRAAPVPPSAMLLVFLSVPFTMGMESEAGDQPLLLSVSTSVIIDAPPERVWPNVVAFSPIPPQRDWILHTGIAYPIRARIDGHGVGAVRHCIFTTGEFVEPIEVWDENHLLRFSVSQQPEPMEELSPYPRLKTPHLHNYLLSREGELRLTALPEGKTLLTGTTWYTDQIWPDRYWQLWSDMIIHRIHLRVLNHIKNLTEHRSVASSP